MAVISMSRHVDAAPNVVFDLCTDVEHFADHVSGIKKCELLTEGPVGVGTRFRESRVMLCPGCAIGGRWSFAAASMPP